MTMTILPREPGLAELLGGGMSQGMMAGMQQQQQQAQLQQILGMGGGGATNATQGNQNAEGRPMSGAPQPMNITPQQILAATMTGNQSLVKGMVGAADLSQKQQEFQFRQQEARRSYANENVKEESARVKAMIPMFSRRREDINQIRIANETGNTGYFSPSNLSTIINNISGNKLNLPMDASGSALMGASKNLLKDQLQGLGVKGLNQWLEQLTKSAQADVGKSVIANRVLTMPLETMLDIDQKYAQVFAQKENRDEGPGGPGYLLPSSVREAQKEVAEYAKKRINKSSFELQTELEKDSNPILNRLSGKPLYEVSENEKKYIDSHFPLKKVAEGTPLTENVGKILAIKYPKDPHTAQKVAIKLGYTIFNPEDFPLEGEINGY